MAGVYGKQKHDENKKLECNFWTETRASTSYSGVC